MKGQKYGDIDYTEGITNKTGFVLKGRTKKYFMIAENEQTCQRWLTNIKVLFFSYLLLVINL